MFLVYAIMCGKGFVNGRLDPKPPKSSRTVVEKLLRVDCQPVAHEIMCGALRACTACEFLKVESAIPVMLRLT